MASLDLAVLTVSELRLLLSKSEVTSAKLVDLYVARIRQHDDYLRAVLQIAPTARANAQRLDDERRNGRVRGPLHGIPVLLKDNIATDPSLGLDTTAGSFALKASRPKGNARIVDQLLAAGAVILGKTNLSLSNMKGNLQPGWSAVGGQTQSAYVRGGLVPDGSILGHSSPGGSSTGSAVAVSAGYAPVSVGTETDGSLVTPGNRAALFALRPTQGLVSTHQIVPASKLLDVAGPMAKTAEDLATLLEVLVDPKHPFAPEHGYSRFLTKSWSGLKVGVLDPAQFVFAPDVMKPEPSATEQMTSELRAAYKRIEPLADAFHHNISYVTLDDLEYQGKDVLYTLMPNDFKKDLDEYLIGLDSSPVRTLEELVAWNKEHAAIELPPGAEDQSFLEDAIKSSQTLTSEAREKAIVWAREAGRTRGIDRYLEQYDIDVIIGPADCECTEPAAAAGYPLGTMPLSYLGLNGRPFGVSITARAGEEGKIIQAMSAWEATFPPRKPPPMLQRPAGPGHASGLLYVCAIAGVLLLWLYRRRSRARRASAPFSAAIARSR